MNKTYKDIEYTIDYRRGDGYIYAYRSSNNPIFMVRDTDVAELKSTVERLIDYWIKEYDT